MGSIKKANDFVLGILMMILSACLFFGKVTTNIPNVSQGGTLARPDVWLQMIAALLFIVSAILTLSSFRLKKEERKEGFQFTLNGTIILTVVSLILYALLLPAIGFWITTFVMIAFLTALYTMKEEKIGVRELKKENILRIGGRSIAAAVILMIVLWLVFAKLLAIQLP